MRYLILALGLTSFHAFADTVPVVRLNDFTVGRSWVWDYSQVDTGERTSTEKYTVIEVRGAHVSIEMSTQFPGETEFHAHHRLLVPVDRCLDAYRTEGARRAWSFRMFYRDEAGRWTEMVPPTTLAFEEKFNCNPWVSDSASLLTVFREGPDGREFMHKPNRRTEAGWFSGSGADAAVLIEKPFTRNSGFPSYVSRRR